MTEHQAKAKFTALAENVLKQHGIDITDPVKAKKDREYKKCLENEIAEAQKAGRESEALKKKQEEELARIAEEKQKNIEFTPSSELTITQYILIFAGSFVVLLTLCIVWCVRRRRRKQKEPEEIIKRGLTYSVNEYE